MRHFQLRVCLLRKRCIFQEFYKLSSCEEALEKSKLAVSSRLDEIYESLESISAEILYFSNDYHYRSCTLGGKETKDEVRNKILDKIEVEEASIFTLEITGHWE